MTYPCDAITTLFSGLPNSNELILPAVSSTRTILGAYITGFDGDNYVQCGPDFIASLSSFNASPTQRIADLNLTYKTSNACYIFNTSPSFPALGHIVYVDRDIAATGTIACENKPAISNGFTYGEIVCSVFLFAILTACFAIGFRLFFQKIRVKSFWIKQK
jgi:hypothetical protein